MLQWRSLSSVQLRKCARSRVPMQGKRNDKKWTCNAVSDGVPDHVSMGSPLRLRRAARVMLSGHC
jgi:hypothetical protein